MFVSKFDVVLSCPHCGNQMSQSLSESSTQSVTCSSFRGGCGKGFRVSTTGARVNWVK